MNALQLLSGGDAVTRLVAITLLLMGLLLVTLLKFLKAVFRRIGSWFEAAPAL